AMDAEAVVPVDAALDKVAIGQRLRGRARSVIVEPAQIADAFSAEAVAPELELVGRDGVHAKLNFIAALGPFGPGVAQQAVEEQPELHGRRPTDGGADPLAAVPWLRQANFIIARRQFAFDGSGGERAARPEFGG